MDTQEKNINDTDEISFKDLVGKIKFGIKYLKSKWATILVVALLCGVLGIVYSILKKPRYTAVSTFVLEDSKSGGMGQYAGLASLAGINIGGGSSGGGIFEGDNILVLYTSRLMIEKALLSTATFNGKKQLLIDRYISYYNLRDKWKNDPSIANISFNGNPDNFNRKQDSIITNLVDLFNLKTLNVTKPDKKLSIIKVEVTTKDELFSKLFTENLVQTVNDFYIQTKTKKTSLNVQVLQRQADSVRTILNSSLNGVASAVDAAPNANPLMSTLKVTSQKRQIDVQANTAIYSEIVKNLELAKISFRQEMPLIQVIDKPVLPLLNDKLSKLKGALMGMTIGAILIVLGLTIKKVFSSI